MSPRGSFRFPQIPDRALQKSPTRTTNRPGQETLLESLPPPTRRMGEKRRSNDPKNLVHDSHPAVPNSTGKASPSIPVLAGHVGAHFSHPHPLTWQEGGPLGSPGIVSAAQMGVIFYVPPGRNRYTIPRKSMARRRHGGALPPTPLSITNGTRRDRWAKSAFLPLTTTSRASRVQQERNDPRQVMRSCMSPSTAPTLLPEGDCTWLQGGSALGRRGCPPELGEGTVLRCPGRAQQAGDTQPHADWGQRLHRETAC